MNKVMYNKFGNKKDKFENFHVLYKESLFRFKVEIMKKLWGLKKGYKTNFVLYYSYAKQTVESVRDKN